jgi:pimeloyl-ACP methyl ester carboxylesterase
MPRLVIHGREDGIPIAGARAWVAGQPNARIVEVSPAGHFPFLELEDQVLPMIDQFLAGQWPPQAVALPMGAIAPRPAPSTR